MTDARRFKARDLIRICAQGLSLMCD